MSQEQQDKNNQGSKNEETEINGTMTENMKKLLELAEKEARKLGHAVVGTEHLLLALLRTKKGKGMLTLERCLSQDGKEPEDRIGRAVEEALKQRPAGEQPEEGSLPLTENAGRVLEHAPMEMERLSHKLTGTEHLLLAFLLHEECKAANILKCLGLNSEVILQELNLLLLDSMESL